MRAQNRRYTNIIMGFRFIVNRHFWLCREGAASVREVKSTLIRNGKNIYLWSEWSWIMRFGFKQLLTYGEHIILQGQFRDGHYPWLLMMLHFCLSSSFPPGRFLSSFSVLVSFVALRIEAKVFCGKLSTPAPSLEEAAPEWWKAQSTLTWGFLLFCTEPTQKS